MRVDIDGLLDKLIPGFSRLDELSANADVKRQRHHKFTFPEKLDFDGVQYRTSEYNAIVEVMYLNTNKL
jgi:hypothetical protein